MKKNILYIIGIVIAFIFYIGTNIIKSNDENKTLEKKVVEENNYTDLDFFGCTITTGDYYIDYEKGIAEIHIVTDVMDMNENDLPVLMVKDSNNDKVLFKKIKSNKYYLISMQNYYYENSIIQFKITDDFDYLIFQFTQKKSDEYDENNIEVKIDFRNFKEAKLIKKSEKWLINQEKNEIIYSKKEYQLNELKKQINEINDEMTYIKSTSDTDSWNKLQNQYDELKKQYDQQNTEFQKMKNPFKNRDVDFSVNTTLQIND